MPQRLVEHRVLQEADRQVDNANGRLAVQIITPGWGSSGHYSPQVLSEAAQRRVFPAGLQMFLDHPTATENADRPERSVRDLAAVLTSDATVDPDTGALVAEAQVFAPHRDAITSMAEAIGLSIRALGQFEMGEAEGRQGRLITSLDEAMSVDFVTAAGRGGRILEVLESAGAAWLTQPLSEATANDTQQALCNAVRERYTVPDQSWAYVRDYDVDAGLVYFDVSSQGNSGTFQQEYSLNADGTAELAGEPVEVTVRTIYVPVLPAGQSTTTESQGGTMPEIEEARLRQLETDAGRVTTLESERDTALSERDEARQALAAVQARIAARPVVQAVVAESTTLPPATVTRVTEDVLSAATLNAQGQLDEAQLRTAAETARTAAETEIAEALQAAGAGRVRGFGGGTGQTNLSEADIDRRSASVFGRPAVKGV